MNPILGITYIILENIKKRGRALALVSKLSLFVRCIITNKAVLNLDQPTASFSFSAFSASCSASIKSSMSPSMKAERLYIV